MAIENESSIIHNLSFELFICKRNILQNVSSKYLSVAEIEEILNASDSDEEDDEATQIRKADKIDIVILPPDKVDQISDSEDVDEENQVQHDDNANALIDTAGQVELNCEFNEENDELPAIAKDEMLHEQKSTVTPPKDAEFQLPKWSKESYEFSKEPVDLTCESTTNLFEKIGNILSLYS